MFRFCVGVVAGDGFTRPGQQRMLVTGEKREDSEDLPRELLRSGGAGTGREGLGGVLSTLGYFLY